MRKLYVLLLPLLTVGAMAVSASAASAATVVHEGSLTGPTYSGSLSAKSTNLKFHTTDLTLECASSTLTGSTLSTGIGEITAGTFLNSEGGVECKTSVEHVTSVVTLEELPWSLAVTYMSASDITVAVTPQTTPITFHAVFSNGLVCTYETSSVSGTWHNPSVIDTDATPFTEPEYATTGCPETGTLEAATFAVTPTDLYVGP